MSAKRVVDRVKRILAGKEPDHPDCAVCGLSACAGPAGCCPTERHAQAVTWMDDVYVHEGTCLRRFVDDPSCVGEAKFRDNRIVN